MWLKIVAAIVFGSLFGFISSLILGSAFGAQDNVLVYGIYAGMLAGLLIVLITEVNQLQTVLKKKL